MDAKEKERLAEYKFKEWLDEYEIPFWYIYQEPDTFASVFRKEKVKRPDFKENGRRYSGYFAVPIEDSIIVSKNQGIEKLLSEMMNFI